MIYVLFHFTKKCIFYQSSYVSVSINLAFNLAASSLSIAGVSETMVKGRLIGRLDFAVFIDFVSLLKTFFAIGEGAGEGWEGGDGVALVAKGSLGDEYGVVSRGGGGDGVDV